MTTIGTITIEISVGKTESQEYFANILRMDMDQPTAMTGSSGHESLQEAERAAIKHVQEIASQIQFTEEQ